MILPSEEYIQASWDKANQYIKDVEDETILTNENIKLAIQRHKDDLLREDLEFRPEAVTRVFDFMSELYIGPKQQFTLQPFQAALLMMLFGFYYKNTNTRKYTNVFFYVARKNGKTTLMAALQFYFLIADYKPYPMAVLIAPSQAHAQDLSLAKMEEMIRYSPALNKRLELYRATTVRFKDKKRLGWAKTMPALVADRMEGMNPTTCILDELHLYKDGQRFNVIRNALGTIENPMLFLISTAGYGKESFCAQLVEAGRNVLRKIVDDDRFFYYLYELEEGDDFEDETTWIKANPALGTILDKQMFRDFFKSACTMPSTLDDFLTKRFNIYLDENSSWIEQRVLMNAFTKEFDEAELHHLPCYVGIDLSYSRDLTSIGVLWHDETKDRYYYKNHFLFVDTGENSLRKGNVDIRDWLKKGYVEKCKTPTIDYDRVKEILQKIYNDNEDVRWIGYDPWFIQAILPDVRDMGYATKPVRPTAGNFDGPVRFMEELFYQEKIKIEYNPCMIWNMRNVVIVRNQDAAMRPNKNKSNDAIDGVISLLNAANACIAENQSTLAAYIRDSLSLTTLN